MTAKNRGMVASTNEFLVIFLLAQANKANFQSKKLSRLDAFLPVLVHANIVVLIVAMPCLP